MISIINKKKNIQFHFSKTIQNSFILVLILCCTSLYAQSNIAGYVDFNNSVKNRPYILLTTIKKDIDNNKSNIIAVIPIDKKGYFNIDLELPEKQEVYTVIATDSVSNITISQDFLLSNNDSIFFYKSNIPFSRYNNTSPANAEWQKLKLFKEGLEGHISNDKKYLNEIRNYHKDSLQILAVKLLGIKELNEKKLLEQDVALNSKYYINLLKELKSSDISSDEYIFLENKLTAQSLLYFKSKFKYSKWLNLILGSLVLGLLFYVFVSKRIKKTVSVQNLSKQEINIKNYILQGKSNKEIGNELFISLSTVKTHITSIYSKLNVSNRSELLLKVKK